MRHVDIWKRAFQKDAERKENAKGLRYEDAWFIPGMARGLVWLEHHEARAGDGGPDLVGFLGQGRGFKALASEH